MSNYTHDDAMRDLMWLSQILPSHPQDSEPEGCPTCSYNRLAAYIERLEAERDWLAEHAACAFNGEYEEAEGDNARKWLQAAHDAVKGER